MPRETFKAYYRQMHGEEGMWYLPARLERAIAKGTNSRLHASAEEMVALNKAGPGDETISLEEVIRIYFTERPQDGPEDAGEAAAS